MSGLGDLVYPCAVAEARGVPMLSAAVEVELNFPSVTLVGGAGYLSYECDGRISINATAEKLVFEGAEISDIVIFGSVFKKEVLGNSSTISKYATTATAGNATAAAGNATFVEGYVAGKITVSSSVTIDAYFMFNSWARTFQASLKLTIDKPPLFLEIEAAPYTSQPFSLT